METTGAKKATICQRVSLSHLSVAVNFLEGITFLPADRFGRSQPSQVERWENIIKECCTIVLARTALRNWHITNIKGGRKNVFLTEDFFKTS